MRDAVVGGDTAACVAAVVAAAASDAAGDVEVGDTFVAGVGADAGVAVEEACAHEAAEGHSTKYEEQAHSQPLEARQPSVVEEAVHTHRLLTHSRGTCDCVHEQQQLLQGVMPPGSPLATRYRCCLRRRCWLKSQQLPPC